MLEATPITDELYREYSEEYFNVLLSELEELQETGSDVEAEYSVCCLFLLFSFLVCNLLLAFFFSWNGVRGGDSAADANNTLIPSAYILLTLSI